jgi:hypothetical protein
MAAVFCTAAAFKTESAEKAECALGQVFMATLLLSLVFLTNQYDCEG